MSLISHTPSRPRDDHAATGWAVLDGLGLAAAFGLGCLMIVSATNRVVTPTNPLPQVRATVVELSATKADRLPLAAPKVAVSPDDPGIPPRFVPKGG